MKNDQSGLDRLNLVRTDLDDGIVDMIFLRHLSQDDSPTAGDGIGISWRLEEDTNNTEFAAASLEILSTDITDAAEDIDWKLNTMIAGTLTEFLHVDADGGFILQISPLIVRSADPTTEIMIDNTAIDGDPYLSWALSGVRKFTFGVDDGDGDKLKIGTTGISVGTLLEFDTEIRVRDDVKLAFGDASEFTISYDESGENRLEIDPSTADGIIAIGTNAVADLILTGDASTLTWDADGNTNGELILDGGRLRINDDDKLVFGDAGEASFEYDENGTDHLRYDGVDFIFDTATKLLFRDTALFINSSADGQLDLDADVELEFTSPTIQFVASTAFDVDANTIYLGSGGAGLDVVATFIGETNSGILNWMEDEDYFQFDDDILLSNDEYLYFRDTAIFIHSSADGQLDLNADVTIDLTAPTVSFTVTTFDINSDDIQLGTGTDNDIVLTFDANTNDGELKWMEDEDYFEFTDDILVALSENVYLRDVAIHINSSVDGQLDIDADGEVEITSPIVQIVASNQLDADTNLFNFGTGADADIVMNFIANSNSGLLSWMEDEDYFEFADSILMTTTAAHYFRDTALLITSSADGQLDIDADVEVEITAPTIDLVGNVDISNGADITGNITVTGTVDGVDIAGFNAVQFVAMALDGNVANERVLTAGDGIDLSDGGAGGNASLAVDVSDILGNGLGETANNIYVYELRESDDDGAALTADADGRLLRHGAEFANLYEWIEDFDNELSGVQFEAGLVADFWTTAGTNYNANNVTYAAGAGGTVQAVTPGADNDSVTAMGVSNFRVDSNPILEARFKVTDIANVFIAAGFVEGSFADKVAPDDDIALVGIDSDNGHGFGANQIIFISNDNNAGAVSSDCGATITANTYITIRIDLADTEQPRVWVNATGGQITAGDEIAAASITGTVQAGISIAPYFMVQSLSAAADTFTIDYIKCWQTR